MKLNGKLSRRGRLATIMSLGIATIAIASVSTSFDPGTDQDPVIPLPCKVDFFEPGWNISVSRKMPEDVSALLAVEDPSSFGDSVFVGTAPSGGVYRYNSSLPAATNSVALGLGDRIENGTCAVSCLVVRDIDHDGTDELLAETCQITPAGRPRLYVWSLSNPVIPRGVARPQINSSWSHGLGFLDRGTGRGESIFSTYCGHGEIVEFQLSRESSADGFQYETLGWRKIGQLPASGEGTQVIDVDNDGRLDVCLATGFAVGNAAIHVYSTSEFGIDLQPIHILNEGNRFGNVKFKALELAGDAKTDVLAWWCTDLADGDCEVIRYQLGPNGLEQREVITHGDAGSLWPVDGQITRQDMENDGMSEVWFATTNGDLWRYDPSRQSVISRICHIGKTLGPICGAPNSFDQTKGLYIGCGEFVLKLSR